MPRATRSLQDPQAGATTIILVLILLALLSAGVLGMSRNTLREVAMSGTGRQGAMARNVADSGIEWAVFWLDPANALKASGSSLELVKLKTMLAQHPNLAGQAHDPRDQGLYSPGATPPESQNLPGPSSFDQGYTVALTYMGKLPIADMSQGIGGGAFTPATGGPVVQSPDLWAVRSDSQVSVGSGLTATKFTHAKEAWVSTPQQ